jgi:hypothetical protein
MTNRFDLEQDIMDCWNITKDLDHVIGSVQQSQWDLDHQQRMITLLTGLRELYELKFNKCFNTFEQCIKNHEI